MFDFQRNAKGDPRLGELCWLCIVRLQPQERLSRLVGKSCHRRIELAVIGSLLWRQKPLLPTLYIAHVMQRAIGVKPLTFYYYYEAVSWLTVALPLAMRGVTLRKVRLDVVAPACALALFVNGYVA
jgi:hypothetical protein